MLKSISTFAAAMTAAGIASLPPVEPCTRDERIDARPLGIACSQRERDPKRPFGEAVRVRIVLNDPIASRDKDTRALVVDVRRLPMRDASRLDPPGARV
jgi:hypothetical protein